MPALVKESYWASLISEIRTARHWSQEEFAGEVFSNQATVSRWELGQVVPSFEKQRLIERIAEQIGLASLNGVAEVVRESPFEMILTDKAGIVMAASQTSGFATNTTVAEQTPNDEVETYREFETALKQSGFWESGGRRFEYKTSRQASDVRAIVISVGVRGNVYAVIQKVSSAP